MAPPTRLMQLHADAFDFAARQRGIAYYHQGRVTVLAGSATSVQAIVRGSSRYEVLIDNWAERDAAEFICDCAAAATRNCKHAFAVLMALDDAARRQGRGQAAGPGQLPAALEAAVGMMQSQLAPPPSTPSKPSPPKPSTPPTPSTTTRPPTATPPRQLRIVPATVHPSWMERLGSVLPTTPVRPQGPVPVVDFVVYRDLRDRGPQLHVLPRARYPARDGSLGAPRNSRVGPALLASLPAAARAVLECLKLANADAQLLPWRALASDLRFGDAVAVEPAFLAQLLPLLARTQVVRPPQPHEQGVQPVLVDVGEPFTFELLPVETAGKQPRLGGCFRRGDQALEVKRLGELHDTDALLAGNRLIRTECGGAVALVNELSLGGPIEVPEAELPLLLRTLAAVPGADRFMAPVVAELPAASGVPVLMVTVPKQATERLPAALQFDYGGELVAQREPSPFVPGEAGLARRDAAAEQAAHERLLAAGLKTAAEPGYSLATTELAAVTATLTAAGFRVLAAGRRLRPFRDGSSSLTTAIDWFELAGQVQFDGATLTLPELLRRPVTPDGFVELDDGSTGMLPASWLRRLEAIRALGGDPADDVLRVPNSRSLLLDALLSRHASELDDMKVDAAFARMRVRLQGFTQLQPATEPAGFAGELRPYQRQGLGWLMFLRDFGLGGCLADDMGLGKTVQVLALLVATKSGDTDGKDDADDTGGTGGKGGRRSKASKASDASKRSKASKRAPSLLVAPRSVLGNWAAEAQRFAPHLRVLDFGTPDRWQGDVAARFADHDLVLTTYAMLRVDAPQFHEAGMRFHYAILDEAQAVKNADSQSAKAARLLAAAHRLVLTGTPVENGLGDLWSLFEFLNPGMLGRLPAFRALFGRGSDADALTESRELVQRALRPVLLRRTKAQVLTDLPEKVEQTLWCQMAPPQRKHYDALRQHYRMLLLEGADELDNKERFIVLEALLRLRQAACHEGLLPGGKPTAESAKFEELLPRLEEIAAGGHKALVFSQFTTLLDLLEPQLQRRGIGFERLDGRTRKRAEHIERFQQSKDVAVFLISLKAGGFGLNLTAASYVFVLDPWWNPAAEMQAIDRAHRIGQRRVVNAYRIICRDTVEERVLELQRQKRALCEAILGNERSLLQDLTRADLALLLG